MLFPSEKQSDLEITANPVFQAVMQCSQDGICLLDQQGQIVYCNPALISFLAYTPTQLDDFLLPVSGFSRLKQSIRYQKSRDAVFLLELKSGSKTLAVKAKLTQVQKEFPVWVLYLSDLQAESALQNTLAEDSDSFGLLGQLPTPAIIVKIVDGQILLANEEFTAHYGFSFSSLHQVSIFDVFFHRSDWLFLLEESRRKRAGFQRDIQITHIDQQVSWARVAVKHCFFEGYESLMMTLTDITQTKQIEKSLDLRNQIVKAMVTAQSQFISQIEPETLFLHILNDLLSMSFSDFGFMIALNPIISEPIELLAIENTRWSVDTSSHYAHIAHQEFLKLYQENHPVLNSLQQGQWVLLKPQGSFADFPWMNSFAGIPLFSSGKLVGMLGLANSPYEYDDVFQVEFQPLFTLAGHLVAAWQHEYLRLKAERALNASHQELSHVLQDLQQLLETACTPIFALDTQAFIQFWNASIEDLTSYTGQDMLSGTVIYQILDISSYSDFDQAFKTLLNGGTVKALELYFKPKGERQEIKVLCSLTPRRNAQGKLIGIWGIGQDITHLINYQAQLQQEVNRSTHALKNALLEQKQLTDNYKTIFDKEQALNAFKDRFVTIASHEFRGPLAAILLASENLLRLKDLLKPEDIQQKISRIRQRAQQLSYVVNDIMQSTQINEGHIRFHPESSQVTELCEQIVEEILGQTSHSHHIHVSCELSPDTVRLDPNIIRLILGNLLHNAVKYSWDCVDVWLRVYAKDKELLFEIEDHGIGISNEELPYVFEPFFRSERVIHHTSGSGLGLDLVKRLSSLHQGQITINRLEKGCIFCLAIPLRY